MKKIFLSLSVVCLAMLACNNQPEKDNSLSSPSSTPTTNSPAADVAEKQTLTNPSQPAAVNVPVKAPVSNPANTSTNVITAGLNPAHGQPNHRCDIPVGAPLNSPAAPANKVNPVPATAVPSVAQPVMPTATTGSGKINPPHGQPGHSCAIAVGAPLP